MRWDALNFLPKIPCAIYEDIKKIARDAIESNVICAPSIFNKLGSFILSSLLHLLHLPLPMGLPTSLAARVDSFPVDMWVLGLTIADFFCGGPFLKGRSPSHTKLLKLCCMNHQCHANRLEMRIFFVECELDPQTIFFRTMLLASQSSYYIIDEHCEFF